MHITLWNMLHILFSFFVSLTSYEFDNIASNITMLA